MLKCEHPGTILKRDFMTPSNLNATQTAKGTQLSIATISQLTKHRRNVTAPVALKLGAFFGGGADYWMRLQNDYDVARALDEIGTVVLDAIEDAAARLGVRT